MSDYDSVYDDMEILDSASDSSLLPQMDPTALLLIRNQIEEQQYELGGL